MPIELEDVLKGIIALLIILVALEMVNPGTLSGFADFISKNFQALVVLAVIAFLMWVLSRLGK